MKQETENKNWKRFTIKQKVEYPAPTWSNDWKAVKAAWYKRPVQESLEISLWTKADQITINGVEAVVAEQSPLELTVHEKKRDLMMRCLMCKPK